MRKKTNFGAAVAADEQPGPRAHAADVVVAVGAGHGEERGGEARGKWKMVIVAEMTVTNDNSYDKAQN